MLTCAWRTGQECNVHTYICTFYLTYKPTYANMHILIMHVHMYMYILITQYTYACTYIQFRSNIHGVHGINHMSTPSLYSTLYMYKLQNTLIFADIHDI